jgi:hypothetical protein
MEVLEPEFLSGERDLESSRSRFMAPMRRYLSDWRALHVCQHSLGGRPHYEHERTDNLLRHPDCCTPIAGRDKLPPKEFSLGKFGPAANGVSIIYCIITSVFLLLPGFAESFSQ